MAIDNFLTDLGDALNQPADDQLDSNVVLNLKLYFKSCMNETDIETASDIYLLEYLRSEFGEWPLMPLRKKNLKKFTNNLSMNNVATFLNSSTSKYGIENYLAKLTIFEMPLIFRFQIDVYERYDESTLLMRLNSPEDFCVIQNFLPSNEQQKIAFHKLMRQLRKLFLYALNDYEDLIRGFSPKFFGKSIIEESLFKAQINEMLYLAEKIYFINNNNYKCGVRR
jgi:hypothetical protein